MIDDGPVKAVSFERREVEDRVEDSERSRIELQSQYAYWVGRGALARDEIAKVDEVRRSRRALEVPPPILFGPLEPGRKPREALVLAPLAGAVVACCFSVWSFLVPVLRLRRPDELTERKPDDTAIDGSARRLDAAAQLRMVVPSAWVRIRQPVGVRLRQSAMAILVFGAAGSLMI